MAYVAVSDISSEFKDISFTSSTPVTDTEVDEFISQEEAVVNAWVGKRYTVPVTLADNPESFKVLKKIATMLVVHRVREIMQVKNIEFEDVQQVTRAGSLWKDAMAMLKQIAQCDPCDLPLPDATLTTTHAGVKAFSVDNSLEFEYKRGEDQW